MSGHIAGVDLYNTPVIHSKACIKSLKVIPKYKNAIQSFMSLPIDFLWFNEAGIKHICCSPELS